MAVVARCGDVFDHLVASGSDVRAVVCNLYMKVRPGFYWKTLHVVVVRVDVVCERQNVFLRRGMARRTVHDGVNYVPGTTYISPVERTPRMAETPY